MSETIGWPALAPPRRSMIAAMLAAIVLATTLVVAPIPLPLTAVQVAHAHDPPEVCTTVHEVRYVGVAADGTRYGRYTVPVTTCRPGPHGSHGPLQVLQDAARPVVDVAAPAAAGYICGPWCMGVTTGFVILYHVIPPGENPQCNPAETGIANCPR